MQEVKNEMGQSFVVKEQGSLPKNMGSGKSKEEDHQEYTNIVDGIR